MKALLLEDAKGAQSARVADVPLPEPQPGEVRVAIRAASVNHREMWIARGLYPGMTLPATLGCDGAGIVDKVGEGVASVVPGDEVVIYPGIGWGASKVGPAPEFGLLGMPFPGTIAQYICVPASSLIAKPESLSFAEAAATILTGLTAWRALIVKGQPQMGDKVLISGIGGGVATFALAFAVAHGLETYVTADSDAVLERACAMGAKGGLLYIDPEWRKQIGKLTGGVDIVIDGAPGPSLPNYVRAINPGARIVVYGSTAGDKIDVAATAIFLKSASIIGTQVGDLDDFRAMLAFVEQHGIKPVIEKAFPMAEADRALLYLEQEHRFGKVVVTM